MSLETGHILKQDLQLHKTW